MPEKDVTPLAWKIELLLMDVDGVLTDGKLLLIPMPDGNVVEAKAFNVNDGAALAMAMAGVGLTTDLRSLSVLGARPLYLGALSAAFVAGLALLLAALVGPHL